MRYTPSQQVGSQLKVVTGMPQTRHRTRHQPVTWEITVESCPFSSATGPWVVKPVGSLAYLYGVNSKHSRSLRNSYGIQAWTLLPGACCSSNTQRKVDL